MPTSDLDNAVIAGTVNVENRITAYDVDWPLGYGRTPYDRENTDGIPLVSNSASTDYPALVLSYGPAHYYRLKETSGVTLIDTVNVAHNGTYNTDCAAFTIAGPIYTETSQGKLISNSKYATVTGGLAYTLGQVTAMSINLWYKSDTRSSDYDGYLGQLAAGTGTSDHGFAIIHNNRKLQLVCKTNGHTEAIDTSPFGFTQGEWHMITFTVALDGTALVYVDGQIISTKSFAYSLGVKLPATTKNFTIGRAAGFDDLPNAGISDLSVFSSVLTPSQVFEMFTSAIVGKGATVTNPDGNTVQEVPLPQFKFTPSLVNATDITRYVTDWTITNSHEMATASASLQMVDGWRETAVRDIMTPMKYIVIEQRYTNPQSASDTGWVSLGHFFNDGPVGDSVEANGQSTNSISLKGVMKLMMLNDVNYPISPDIIKENRVEAVRVDDSADVISYRILRPGTTDQYYYNWTDKPAVRIWISQFTTTGDIWRAGEVYPGRSPEGSIVVLGGLGQINFGREFFEGKLRDGNFGAPNKVELEVYRFAVYEDVVLTTVLGGAYAPYNTTSAGKIVRATINVDNTSGKLTSTTNYVGRTLIMKAVTPAVGGNSAGARFKVLKQTFTTLGGTPAVAFDVSLEYSGIPDFSDYEFIGNDPIQVTDANLLPDAIAKPLLYRGFQMKDSSKPLFLKIDPPTFLTQGRPSFYTYDDNIQEVALLKDILSDAPPNFYIKEERDGSLFVGSIVQKTVADYDITNCEIGHTSDFSDYGVITRLRGIGESGRNYNAGLHSDYGGTTVSGAYKLNEVYTLGTVSQSTMNTYIKQVFDLNSTTPRIGGDSPYNNGLLYEYSGDSTTCNFFKFADEDLFWVDLGKNSVSGNPWAIEDIEFVSFSSFKDGELVPQSLRLYYLTEEDYVTLTGHTPPAIPSTEYSTIQTNMLALKTSKAWKPLIDEIQTPAGLTKVNKADFSWPRKEKFRFVKVVCGQCWFRFGGTNKARIVLSNLKFWLDRTIIQTVELGVDSGFDSSAAIARAAMLRPRHVNLQRNITLDTPAKVRQFLNQELREVAVDFEPYSFSTVATLAGIHDTISYKDAESGTARIFLVRSYTRGMNCKVDIQAVDYTEIDK
jgi:hypothetical protein